jgi:hypothetical protein
VSNDIGPDLPSKRRAFQPDLAEHEQAHSLVDVRFIDYSRPRAQETEETRTSSLDNHMWETLRRACRLAVEPR